MFLHWAFLVSRFNAKFLSKISNICKVYFNICKVFFSSKFASNTNVFPLGFSRVQVQCKVFFIICIVFFNIGKVFFSKFASIINALPLGFSRVRVQCKVYFSGSVSKQGKSGKYIFFDHFPKPSGGFKIGPKSQPISTFNYNSSELFEIHIFQL